MEFTRENYEAYYLDYLEGSLAEELLIPFEAFLEKNPDLQVDFESIDLSISDQTIVLDSFEKSLAQLAGIAQLRITKKHIELFIIAELEGLLTPSQMDELHLLIQSDERLQHMYSGYQLTRIQSQDIRFEDKAALKQVKVIRFRPILLWSASVAALFILFISLWSTNKERSTQFIAKKQPVFNEEKEIKHPKIRTKQPILAHHTLNKEIKEIYRLPLQSPKITYTEKSEIAVLSSILPVDTITSPVKIEVQAQIDLAQQTQQTTKGSIFSTIHLPALSTVSWSNPIRPITRELSRIARKEIDYQVKETKTERKGIYIKIGGFEFYRSKS